ncbi:uncharacterized protein LOC131995948 [Stomoxys calcitrans]|uniref:uncharacterized protein LOC131995948 n=1 Tax=Stomoxys calcitrans TaxID=35570 RepID=UPI0027E30803|nr:uncharacterized protein LOC131995948 [Stomoxys calcitrans]
MASEEPIPPELPPQSETTSTDNTSVVCEVCKQLLVEGQDCLIISACAHPFHRNCIETYLSSSAECPVCKRVCDLGELRTYSMASKPPPARKAPNNRGKGRGALNKTYETRSVTKNLFQDAQNPTNTQPATRQTPQQCNNTSFDFTTPPQQNIADPQALNSSVDYREIGRMIEDQLRKFFHNMNLPHTATSNNIPNLNRDPRNVPNTNAYYPSGNCVNMPSNFPNHRPPNPPNMGGSDYPRDPRDFQFPRAAQFSSPNASGSFSSMNRDADKITSIVNNWNLKFDGSSTGLSIDEFLYRIRTLTRETFNDDFSVICRNLNTLLTGKAREWYWRYHKQVPAITWEGFCQAIRSQYKDMKSSFDLREEMRIRKQKPGESYDAFFDALSIIADKLSNPMSEDEFIEIIARNLRPDIRQDLLYVPIRSLSHLRKLVQMRENFLSDEYVRRTLSQRSQNLNFPPRRQLAELDQGVSNDTESDYTIDAVQRSESIRCWNCDNIGHTWQDCLEDRTIFCYGCGAKNVYKPQCARCLSRVQSSSSKNYRQTGPTKNQV